jgi:hypothetical protein
VVPAVQITSIFCLLFFSLANISTIIHEVRTESGYLLSSSWDDTFRAENMIQLGMLSLVPYIAELVLEQGFVRAVLNVLHQVVAGSLAFFITRWVNGMELWGTEGTGVQGYWVTAYA